MKKIPFLLFLSFLSLQQISLARDVRPTLFIALDGVPYSLMQELKEKGHFRDFQKPTKVITTFPSTTTSGFSGMFETIGAGKPPGYDEKYFSEKDQRVKGSILGGLEHGQHDYREIFDFYRETLGSQFMMYFSPLHTAKNDLKRIKKIIWKQPQKHYYYVYIGSTDGMGHIAGEKRLRKWLLHFDTWLKTTAEEYQKTFQTEIDIVLFSDHGFQFHKLKPMTIHEVKARLKQENLLLENKIRNHNSVVSISWGNISGASFYLNPSFVAQTAHVLTEIEGMDLVFYRYEDRIVILSKEKALQRAHILFDAHRNAFAYLPLQGDPLGYQTVLKKLQSQGKLDEKGFAYDRDWFEATANHHHPDALYRLYAAFYSLVQNPAAILCSIHPKYEFGDFWTRFGASFKGGFQGTHGGLFQESSEAFTMVTNAAHYRSGPIRYNEVFLPFVKTFLTAENFPWKKELETLVRKDNRELHTPHILHVQKQYQVSPQPQAGL